MAAASDDVNGEVLAAGRLRTRGDAGGSGGKMGIDMEGENRARPGEGPGLHHVESTLTGFFRRLKNSPPSPDAGAMQCGDRTENHCRVGIMAAGVHDPWGAGGKIQRCRLLDGQGVEIGAQGNQVGAPARADRIGDESQSSGSGGDRNPLRSEASLEKGGRGEFLPAEFRMPVKVASDFEQLWSEAKKLLFGAKRPGIVGGSLL